MSAFATRHAYVVPVAAWLGALILILAACAPATTSTATPSPQSTPTAAPTESPSPEATEEATATPAESPDAGTGGEEEVELVDFAFEPDELTISVGTTVTFINNDSAPHTVTHGSDGRPAENAEFDEDLPAGESTEITFDEAGTFDVTCTIHPSMNMTITVEG